jgi:Lar family restriction alleviation protein
MSEIKDEIELIERTVTALPCPFCGTKTIGEIHVPPVDGYIYLCTGCGARTQLFETPTLALVKWNRRKQ